MPQSLVKNYIHIVFSTKYRKNIIAEDIEAEVFAYLGGACKQFGCQPIIVGGTSNHVHILCMLSKKITLIKLLEEIKSSSSKWIKTKGERFLNFYWQDGYGSFSVSPKDVDMITRYIQNQKRHHNKSTFEDEYRKILEKHKVEFDERYVWD